MLVFSSLNLSDLMVRECRLDYVIIYRNWNMSLQLIYAMFNSYSQHSLKFNSLKCVLLKFILPLSSDALKFNFVSPEIWHTSLLYSERHEKWFHMMLPSSGKCKNYKQEMLHNVEKHGAITNTLKTEYVCFLGYAK